MKMIIAAAGVAAIASTMVADVGSRLVGDPLENAYHDVMAAYWDCRYIQQSLYSYEFMKRSALLVLEDPNDMIASVENRPHIHKSRDRCSKDQIVATKKMIKVAKRYQR